MHQISTASVWDGKTCTAPFGPHVGTLDFCSKQPRNSLYGVYFNLGVWYEGVMNMDLLTNYINHTLFLGVTNIPFFSGLQWADGIPQPQTWANHRMKTPYAQEIYPTSKFELRYPWRVSHLIPVTPMNFWFVASVLSPMMTMPTKPSSWPATTPSAFNASANFPIRTGSTLPQSNAPIAGLRHASPKMG